MSYELDRAEASLREIGALADRTRRASRSMATGFPLIGWGAAWTAGYAALDLLDGVVRIAVVVLAWVFAMLMSWMPLRAVIRTGVESRMRWAWMAVMVASPFLVAAGQPASMVHLALLLGALWGMAMCLYAITAHDTVFAVVAMFGVVVAGIAGIQEAVPALLLFGLASGLTMLALGIYRVIVGLRHV
ncbi:MAG: hypothetical protein ACTHY8_06930 [Microbacterium gubbeenense]|uniref:hypothetical protein n=1 Tax=Microbacterium gubbeenense TaxID=159896 RepID=UPI00048DA8C7|nr:hypothetical protein [Microbacterium gubbeenense]